MEHYFQPANNFRHRKAMKRTVFKCECFETNSISDNYAILSGQHYFAPAPNIRIT